MPGAVAVEDEGEEVEDREVGDEAGGSVGVDVEVPINKSDGGGRRGCGASLDRRRGGAGRWRSGDLVDARGGRSSLVGRRARCLRDAHDDARAGSVARAQERRRTLATGR